MSNAGPSDSNYCYRHPDRQSYILCQRCGRTVCTECQTQGAVGVHCPECVREAQRSHPRQKSAFRRTFSSGSDRPVVTYSILAVIGVVFLLQLVSGGIVTGLLVYFPQLTWSEPWRMITSMFLHSPGSFLHIIFNGLALFLLGPPLEHTLGRGRFLALYFLSGFGGSIAVLLVSDWAPVLGASGAVFGLLGAYFFIQRHLGGTGIQVLVILGINFVIGFFAPLISWQGHLGGLIVGGAVGYIFTRTRSRKQATAQKLLVGSVGVALVAATALPLFAPTMFPLGL